MKLIAFFISSLFLFGFQRLFSQSGKPPMQGEPGKCYALCLMGDQYEVFEKTFPIYTGEKKDLIELDSIFFEIDAHTNKLIYLGFEENLSESQLKLKETYEKLVFLNYTDEIKDYIEETIVYLMPIKKEEEKVWKEVLCGNKLTRPIFTQIKNALTEKGYPVYGKFSADVINNMKATLKKYQRDHHLPIGHLDLETLKALGVQL